MRVLVTGGAGFIGANLCRTLLKTDGIESIVVLDDMSSGSASNLAGVDVELRVGSILDDDALDLAVTGCDAVVHLAARGSVPRSIADPVTNHVVNATGTLGVLEAARRHGNVHTIFASSSSVYGANPILPKREDLAPRPMSPYAASKLAAEAYTLAYAHSYDMPTLAFRFFNVYGPLQPAGHDYAAVVPVFIDAALHGRPVPLNGTGEQSRDFTFVDSVTSVIASAVVGRVTDVEPVNLAFGTRSSLRDLLAMIGELVGRPLEVDQRPARAGDVLHSQADSTQLRRHFADIEPVGLAAGLQATFEWMSTAIRSQ